LTPDALKQSESNLLAFCDLQPEDYTIEKVKYNEQDHYLNTVIVGQEHLPKMVLIHGYGGSGVLFYKIFHRLKDHFRVYYIDLLGMGSSSRPEFNVQNADEADQYFNDSLE